MVHLLYLLQIIVAGGQVVVVDGLLLLVGGRRTRHAGHLPGHVRDRDVRDDAVQRQMAGQERGRRLGRVRQQRRQHLVLFAQFGRFVGGPLGRPALVRLVRGPLAVVALESQHLDQLLVVERGGVLFGFVLEGKREGCSDYSRIVLRSISQCDGDVTHFHFLQLPEQFARSISTLQVVVVALFVEKL